MKTISTISILLLGISVSFGQVAESIRSASGKDMTPVGVVQMYIATNPPVGWLNCDGTSVSTVTYPALFALIGTNFGSTNAAWFNLPDFRGVFPKGAGTTSRTLGKDAQTNFYSAALGTYYLDKLQGHWHYTYAWG